MLELDFSTRVTYLRKNLDFILDLSQLRIHLCILFKCILLESLMCSINYL